MYEQAFFYTVCRSQFGGEAEINDLIAKHPLHAFISCLSV